MKNTAGEVSTNSKRYIPMDPITRTSIGLYTPINYFGRYAICSHKDDGRLHIQSRETIGQEDHVTCLKLRTRINSRPAFLSHLQDECVCVHLTQLSYKRITCLKCPLFMIRNGQFHWDWKASHSHRIWMSARPIHVVGGSVLLLRRNLVKEKGCLKTTYL